MGSTVVGRTSPTDPREQLGNLFVHSSASGKRAASRKKLIVNFLTGQKNSEIDVIHLYKRGLSRSATAACCSQPASRIVTRESVMTVTLKLVNHYLPLISER